MYEISDSACETFKSYGFEESVGTKMFKKLTGLTPDGGTALRDSIITGLELILKIHKELEASSSTDEYNIIHIVITDGCDESSNTSESDMYSALQAWDRNFGNSVCQTVLVGISLNQKTKTDLDNISYYGGESFRSFNVGNDNISEIFRRISLEFGILNETAIAFNQQNILMVNRSTPYMLMKRKRVALLFNLDFSSSMKGFRWNSLIKSSFDFVEHLTPGDLLTCILFNNEVNILNEVYQEHKAIKNFGFFFQFIGVSVALMQPNETSSEAIEYESESEDQGEYNNEDEDSEAREYESESEDQDDYNNEDEDSEAREYESESEDEDDYNNEDEDSEAREYESESQDQGNYNNEDEDSESIIYESESEDQIYTNNKNQYPAQPIYNPQIKALPYIPANNYPPQTPNNVAPSYQAGNNNINYGNNYKPQAAFPANPSYSAQNNYKPQLAFPANPSYSAQNNYKPQAAFPANPSYTAQNNYKPQSAFSANLIYSAQNNYNNYKPSQQSPPAPPPPALAPQPVPVPAPPAPSPPVPVQAPPSPPIYNQATPKLSGSQNKSNFSQAPNSAKPYSLSHYFSDSKSKAENSRYLFNSKQNNKNRRGRFHLEGEELDFGNWRTKK